MAEDTRKNILQVDTVQSIDKTDTVLVNDNNSLKQVSVETLVSSGIPDQYVTESELNGKGYATTTAMNSGLNEKIDKNQGISNSGKYLSVGSDGNVVPTDAPSGGTVDPEQIKQAVNGYLEENPLQGGITEEQKQQLEQNTQDITDLKNTLSKTNFGWTNQQIVLLQSLFDYLVYSDQETGQSIADSLIYSLKNNTEIPDEPEEPENPEEIYYNITYSLENVTSDNNETRIKKGESYIANLSPSSGYYINSVTITMGGENITSTVYSDGVINISSVNGEIMILAKGAESDNLIKLSECTSDDEKMPDGATVTEGVMLTTPFIEVDGSLIYKTNINRNLPEEQVFSQKCYMYNSEKRYIKTVVMNSNTPYGGMSNFGLDASAKYVRIMFRVENENPYFGISGVIV